MAKRPLTPEARRKLASLLAWARKDDQPVRACMRALQREGYPEDRAGAICAALKDRALGTTKWRKGSK